MVYVAAFVVSCWSNTPFRTSKPFNPLWSETFEFDRTADYGWKSIAEQVSHHPPIAAIHAEGRGWEYDEDMCVHSQFQATAMKLFPEGCATLHFPATKTSYRWTKRDIRTIVKGFIVGPVTVHNEGTCLIQNVHNGEKCRIELAAHSFFSYADERQFTAQVVDRGGKPLYTLDGDWSKQCSFRAAKAPQHSRQAIWSKKAPPEGSDRIYNFSTLAIEMNEMEEGVAPTDSRCRPDMRLMENGEWEKANEEKARLEQKQRMSSRKYQEMMEAKLTVIERPIWFKKNDTRNDGVRYKYQGQYWKCKQTQNWSQCPDLFSRS